MKNSCHTLKHKRGFSLAEVLMAVTIGSMVLVAMLTIYSRAQATSAAIGRNLDISRLPNEVLQLIAEDLDRIMTSGSDIRITVENKVVKGYPGARLKINKTFKDAKNSSKEFETIIWQTSYDYESMSEGLVLYRMHKGIVQEDKLLDDQRQDIEKSYPFVPICSGVTYFNIKVPQGEKLVSSWRGLKMPPGIVVSISFAEPIETGEGTLETLEEDMFTRTIATNRSKKMSFVISAPTIDEEKTPMEDEKGDKKDEDDDKKNEGDKTKKPEPNIRPAR